MGAAPPAKGRVSPVEVVVTSPSQDQPGVIVVAPEGVVQSAPPGAQVDPPVVLEAAQTEEGPAGGSSSTAVVPLRTRHRLFSRSIIIPSSWVFALFSSFSYPCVFVFLYRSSFQNLAARSRNKSRFLHE